MYISKDFAAAAIVVLLLAGCEQPAARSTRGHNGTREDVASAPAPVVAALASKLRISDAATNDLGAAIAISGNRAVVGSPYAMRVDGDEAGMAAVFVRTGSTWTEEAILVADDARPSDNFGYAVDIDGDRIVVGAWSSFNDGLGWGSVYMFERAGGAWQQTGHFIGSPQFGLLGTSVAISGDRVAAGAPRAGRGVVRTYAWSGGAWAFEQELTVSTGNAQATLFGNAVDLDGETLLVGAPGYPLPGGAGFVFRHDGSQWMQQGILSVPSLTQGDLGTSVALDGDVALLGAPDVPPSGNGAAMVFERDGDTWEHTAVLQEEDPVGIRRFGSRVALRRPIETT